jgi:hypothetical protein
MMDAGSVPCSTTKQHEDSEFFRAFFLPEIPGQRGYRQDFRFLSFPLARE